MIGASRCRFCLGLALGFFAAVLLGELLTRLCSPDDLDHFLGDASPSTGIYRPDPELGADYRSLEAFRAEHSDRFRELEEPNQPHRTWLWLGNSFVQARGMLGDLAQADHRDIRMFYLRRNAEFPMQVAQMRLLLNSGLKPERVILVILPIDLVPLSKQPLHTILVNRKGAITYRWQAPAAPVDQLLHCSRLALLAWIRAGYNAEPSSFHIKQLVDEMPPSLTQDLTTVFRVIGQVSRQHDVPVTVLLLPNREQVFGQQGRAFQTFACDRCRIEGIDCLDASNLFLGETDKLSLFLADWHFTDKANRMVLDALYSHWQQRADRTRGR